MENASAEDFDRRLTELLGARGSGWSDAMLCWCEGAVTHMFDPKETERRLLTAWGMAALKTMLLGLMRPNEYLPPKLCVWLQKNVVPALFHHGDTMDVRHPDVTLVLVQCLLQTAAVLNDTASAATTPVVAPAAETPATDVGAPTKATRGSEETDASHPA